MKTALPPQWALLSKPIIFQKTEWCPAQTHCSSPGYILHTLPNLCRSMLTPHPLKSSLSLYRAHSLALSHLYSLWPYVHSSLPSDGPCSEHSFVSWVQDRRLVPTTDQSPIPCLELGVLLVKLTNKYVYTGHTPHPKKHARCYKKK